MEKQQFKATKKRKEGKEDEAGGWKYLPWERFRRRKQS